MKIIFRAIGDKHESYVKEGVEEFTKRAGHYYSAVWDIIASPKGKDKKDGIDRKDAESAMILTKLDKSDFLILLDERGKSLNNHDLADLIVRAGNQSIKQLIFLIGGAYGVNEEVRKRADFVFKLSDLVFPHQLVRLMLAEQVYRACTIIRNEKYHHP